MCILAYLKRDMRGLVNTPWVWFFAQGSQHKIVNVHFLCPRRLFYYGHCEYAFCGIYVPHVS